MKKLLSSALAACTLLLAAGQANAVGALAIDHNHGTHYGWAVNFRSERAADDEALSHCSGDCKIVLNFEHTCGAYAADEAEGSHRYGWAKRDDAEEAKEAAKRECRSVGGTECVVRVFGCDK